MKSVLAAQIIRMRSGGKGLTPMDYRKIHGKERTNPESGTEIGQVHPTRWILGKSVGQIVFASDWKSGE